jgi:ribosome-binding protein aMBF1 (putative translation factor)
VNATQPTNPYREAIQELATSRGYSVEELAARLQEADPEVTLEDLTDWPRYGLGDTLNEVLGMSEEEQLRVVRSLRDTVLQR